MLVLGAGADRRLRNWQQAWEAAPHPPALSSSPSASSVPGSGVIATGFGAAFTRSKINDSHVEASMKDDLMSAAHIGTACARREDELPVLDRLHAEIASGDIDVAFRCSLRLTQAFLLWLRVLRT